MHTTGTDIGPLIWVKSEIDLALARASDAVTQAGHNTGDSLSHIQFAQTHLHQVRGALSIVGLDGLTQFASILDRLLGNIVKKEINNSPAVLSLGRRALASIGNYLEELVHGTPDQPLRLLSMYTELNTACGNGVPSPAELFFPDLSLRPPRRTEQTQILQGKLLHNEMRALRSRFERGLLNWLRSPHTPDGPLAMQEAVSGIEHLQNNPSARTLWWASIAFFDALIDGTLTTDTATKRLCTQLDAQMRRLMRGNITVPDRLMRELLYCIACTPARTPHQKAVHQTWQLDALLPEPGARVSDIPLPPLLATLQGQLTSINEAWDRFSSGTAAELPKFEALLTKLAPQAQQLGRPALDRLFAGIHQFSQWLRKDPLQQSEGIALEIATALLLAETGLGHGAPGASFSVQVKRTLERLDTIMSGQEVPAAEQPSGIVATRQAQERDALDQVSKEILSSLAQIEQTLDDYFRNQEKQAPLTQLAAPMQQIQGALAVLGETEAIALAREAEQTIARFAEATESPDVSEFEGLAQRLSALGFYIASLQHGPGDRALLQLQPHSAATHPAQENTEEEQLSTSAPHLRSESSDKAKTPRTESGSTDNESDLFAPDFPEALFKSDPPPVQAVPERAPATQKLIDASDEEVDAELLAIFIEEAHEVLAAVDQHLSHARSAPGDPEDLISIRRSFHTLKGSGRMVGLREFGEAAWGLEQTLNRWLQLELPLNDALYTLIQNAHAFFSEWVIQLEKGEGHGRDASALLAQAERLRSDPDSPPASVEHAESTPSFNVEEASDGTSPAPAAETEKHADPGADDQLSFETINTETSEIAPDTIFATELPAEEPEHFFSSLFGTEDTTDAASVKNDTAVEPLPVEAETPPAVVNEESVNPDPAAPSAIPDSVFFDLPEITVEELRLEEKQSDAPDRIDEKESATAPEDIPFVLAPSALDYVSIDNGEIFTIEDEPEETARLEDEIEALAIPSSTEEALLQAEMAADDDPFSSDMVRIGNIELSRPLYDLFLAEARHHIATLKADFAALRADPDQPAPDTTMRAAHTLAGISGTARIDPPHVLSRALEHAQQRLLHPASSEELSLFESAVDAISAMLEDIANQRMPAEAPDLIAQLEMIGQTSEIARASSSNAETQPAAALSPALPTQPANAPAAAPVVHHTHLTATDAALEAARAVPDEIDPQLLPIFLEEAAELLNELQSTLRQWKETPDNTEHNQTTARLLHTLKGSARMTGAMGLGEYIHQIESHLKGTTEITPGFIEELISSVDLAELMLDNLALGETTIIPASNAVHTATSEEEEATETESITSATLRVRADMIDRFVNEAGEIGIARTRIEGELRTLRRSLLDLTENVIRLRNQLREVELQADVQMQSRIAQAGSHNGDFDPLEMDRYTRLQELTRMMAESVNDVTTVQQSLLKNLDGADIALLSQARLSRELQQALMHVRMAPFDSLANRLYRVVRQSAKDLGKRANLDLRGGQIEVDRSVLEHMIAPLEHLLRNAVAHGIESPEERKAAGKTEAGQITITVTQEGNEIAISLVDDGRGLNFDKIIERAQANNLLGANEVPDQRRLTNMIFMPGFTTASNVSAISGRGVGMDVVKTETAAVGGRIDVHSEPGTGTTFHIYLPLTLASTQALLVYAGNQTYAIPSSMIVQVMELKPDALDAICAKNGTNWLGEHYPYRYLPHLLGTHNHLPEIQRYNWILLLRSGAQTLALHVDSLRGNQEIVVKKAGPQLSRIVGMSGATVLGNGEIVLIINPVALANRKFDDGSGAAQTIGTSGNTTGTQPVIEQQPARQPIIMVVDDSLTVRKVTSRLLERENYRVVTAKDGIDGLEKLIEIIPDVILSDIEMPRMDGFDFVRNVRADSRTESIPVIMITSRQADKHRKYAEEIGANHYLGKPYQEDELLRLLNDYTAAIRAPV